MIPNVGLNAVAGRPPRGVRHRADRFRRDAPGCYDVDERVKDMNANGVLGSLCFPSFPLSAASCSPHANDKDLGPRACCGPTTTGTSTSGAARTPAASSRSRSRAIWDPELMADEIRRIAAKGCHAVTFSENPSQLGLPSFHSDHWDPFWRACEDDETVVLHAHRLVVVELAMTVARRADRRADHAAADQHRPDRRRPRLVAGASSKFPGLKFALSEGGIGWIPYFLERTDYTYEHHKAWTRPGLRRSAPERGVPRAHHHVLHRRRLRVQARRRHRHRHASRGSATTRTPTPRGRTSPEVVYDAVDGLTDEQIDKITHRNAMRLFSFDPFSIVPREECTVGALRARAVDHDVTPRGVRRPRAPDHHSGRVRRGRGRRPTRARSDRREANVQSFCIQPRSERPIWEESPWVSPSSSHADRDMQPVSDDSPILLRRITDGLDGQPYLQSPRSRPTTTSARTVTPRPK